MRFFDLLDFQTVVLLVFFGLIALVLLCIAFSGLTRKTIPLVLIVVYVSFIVWAVVYAIFIGIRGGPF
jgi:hypothetical protein